MKIQERIIKVGSIQLQDNVKLQDGVERCAIVFYTASSIQKLGQLIGRQICSINGIRIMKTNQTFWLLKCCQSQNQAELEQIQRIVGLSETVICLDLSNVLETFIEKAFCHAENQFLSQFSHKLIFVKEMYQEKESISDIKYFQNVDKLNHLLLDDSIFKTKRIKIADILQLFDCNQAENIAKVKAIYQKYEQIKGKQSKIDIANTIAFDETKSKSEIKNQIITMNLDRQVEKVLLWKVDQIWMYRTWIDEENKNLSQKYQNYTFLEINQRISSSIMFKYHHHWTKNSLERLKRIFDKINNQKNNSFLKQFHSCYEQMKINLIKIKQLVISGSSQQILTDMLKEIDSFYAYHKLVLEDNSFVGSLKFVKGQARYIWKYKNNIYKKMIAFILLGGLAFFQQTYIGSFMIIILTLMTLALRC